MFDIKENLKILPDKPGVYLYKDRFGEIIYVGKALSLKSRVRQYFQSPAGLTPKVRALVSNIDEFEYIVTDSEMEALILENNLIKKNQPRYNVLLRDDKTFPYIKVTLNEKYPRIIKTRKVYNDGAKYFGPYTDAGAVNQIINLLNQIYPIKKCSTLKFYSGFKPCLNYHMNLCEGYCINGSDESRYKNFIDEIVAFLQGKDEKLMDYLLKLMDKEAEELHFEKAAEYRDYTIAINAIKEKQKIVIQNRNEMDVIVSDRVDGEDIYIMVFYIRDGKLTGRESYQMQASEEDGFEEILAAFIKQYYGEQTLIPKEIIVTGISSEKSEIEQWLTSLRGSNVKIVIPQKGEKKALLDMAQKNIVQMKHILDNRAKNEKDKANQLTEALKEVLKLEKDIERIEAYDISNISGEDAVGAMVVFENGKAVKRDYRKFKIRTIEGPNDYGSLQEVIYRRFKRMLEEDNSGSFSRKPDLLLIDGGEKQVSAVQQIIDAMKIDVAVAGMVKDEHHKTRGLVFGGSEINIKDNLELFRFIYFIQEEVHRFAIDYHRNLRGKGLSKSILDQISGIGERRKTGLLAQFGSIDAIKKASEEQLMLVKGMDKRAAKAVKEYFEK